MSLEDIVADLCELRGDLDMAARAQVVDAEEVAEALADADPDTAEFVVLSLLAKYKIGRAHV